MLKGVVEVRGRTLAGKYWYERMHDSPDVVFQIKRVDTIINEDLLSSVVMFDFTLEGTHMVPISPQINASIVKKNEATGAPVYIMESNANEDCKPITSQNDFDLVVGGGGELDFGIDGSLETNVEQNDFLMESSDTSSILEEFNGSIEVKPLENFVLKKNEFAGLKAPDIAGSAPMLSMHATKLQESSLQFVPIPYSYTGKVELMLDADSLIYYSKFLLHNE